MSKQINIGGRLHSTEHGNVITGANEVLDDTKGKKQNVINADVDAELLRLDQSKQNNLTFDNTPTENSNNPVKSSGVYAADKALSDAIEAILILIPSAATALNQLADKSFVNSSIATDTATFRGTSETGLSEAQFLEWANSLTHDMNDYVFWQTIDEAGNTLFKRYKWNGTQWLYEYTLNNSSFTADQWAAIMSGITSALVEKLNGLPTNTALQQALNSKQDALTFDNVPTDGSTNPVKSGGVYSAVKDEEDARLNLAQTVSEIGGDVSQIEDVIPAGATAQNQLVANASMEAYVASIIQNITASFTLATTDGHINLTLTQVNGQVATLTLASSDIASAQALTALTGRVTTAEGNITSLTGRVSTNETDIANLQQLYNDLQQSKPVPVTALPETGQQQGVIYRLAGTTSYSDYMWNGSTWVLMATYNNAIDPRPKKASQNLVTSGGVFDNMGALDVSELNATENPHTLAQYVDLSAALAAIPTDYQKGGMSIKFVQSSDNKYVQYRYMGTSTAAADFTNVANWQGMDDEPTAGSDNLVKSGSVWGGSEETKGSLNIIKDIFVANSSEHSSALDTIDISANAGCNVLIKLSAVTAATNSQSISLYIKTQELTTLQIINGVVLGEYVEVSLPSNAYYVSYYIYKVTTYGIFSVVVRLKESLGDTQKKSAEDGYDINNVRTVLSNSGVYAFSFNVTPYEHSSDSDKYPIAIANGTKVKGLLSIGSAVMRAGHETYQVRFWNSENQSIAKDITLGEPFEFTLPLNAVYVSFYISEISLAGSFYANIDAQKVNTLETAVKSMEEILGPDNIPSYFDSNIETAENAAINDIAFAGVNGENFIFITDMHWEDNARHSPALIKKITNDMCIGNIVFGGDAINGQADQNIARQYFSAISGGLSSCNSPFVAVFGNHDYNANDGGTIFANGDKTFLALFQKKNDYRIDNPTYETYFYYDNKASNTRHIILNYISLKSGSAQETWLTTLLNNTPNDMHIILYMHIYINDQSVYEEGSWIGYDYIVDTPAQTLNNILENTTKKVEAVVAGHLHLDYNGCTPGMIPVVLTDCDTRQTMSGAQALGTKDEQAFDIVTTDFGNKIITCRRIGRRKSRIIHYNTYTLSVNGTLDISALLSITPTGYSIRDNFNFQYRKTGGITYNSTLASINSVGLVTALSSGIVIAVAENDDCIETFNIKIE